jgi:putative membrane protein
MSDTELKITDILAIDRTRLAAERSLMAWVRTALSMITFGFTIYKFLQFIREQSTIPLPRPHAPRNLALALIGIGTLALIIACIQHRKYVRKLGCLLALLGLLMFGSVILNSGPLG